VLRVGVEGSVDPKTGFVMDFGDLSKVVNERVIDRLDHRHLGEWNFQPSTLPPREILDCIDATGLPGDFYPTCENLLMWIGQQLIRAFGVGYYWSELELEETPTSRATLTRKEFDAAAR
jgi:6-pyruvoyl-tetrahydropterin synthase